MRGHCDSAWGPPGFAPGAGPRRVDDPFAQLELSDEQKAKLKELRSEHREEMEKLREEQRQRLEELKDEAFYGGPADADDR